MLCPSCGSDNPDQNRFCGSCGGALKTIESQSAELELARSTPDHELPSPARSEREQEPGISGPSFLGLSDAPLEEDREPEYSYLLEGEPRRGNLATYLVVLVLIGVGVAVAAKWGTIRQYVATVRRSAPSVVASKAASQADAKPTADQPDQQPAATPPQITAEPATIPAAAQQSARKEPDSAANVPANTQQSSTDEPTPAPPTTNSAEPATAEKATEPAPPAKDAQSGAPAKSAESSASASSAENDDTENEPAPAEPKKAAARLTKESTPKPTKDDRLVTLGENYLYGRGVHKSCDQAVTYMKAAAKGQNAKAMSHLGAMYATGECVSQDRPLAYLWLSRARDADPSNTWLERNLNMLWRDMTPDERARSGGPR